MTYVIVIVEIAAAVIIGFIAGYGAVYVFNKMPASWLCDYGQEPSEELKDPYSQRIKGYPWKPVLSGLFTVININLLATGWRDIFSEGSLNEWWQSAGQSAVDSWQFAAASAVFCWALVIIAAADKKYGIIPDQFVILTAISAAGFIPFHDSVMDTILGMVLGSGLMLLAAFIGKILFKQESLGFGDIKLYAAAGLALGAKGIFAVLVISSIVSAVAFSVLIIKGKIKKTDSMPLGPYICGAAIFYVAIICPLV